MITVKGKDNSTTINIHQTDVDNYEVEIINNSGGKSTSNISEKQINSVAKAIANYNDLRNFREE